MEFSATESPVPRKTPVAQGGLQIAERGLELINSLVHVRHRMFADQDLVAQLAEIDLLL
jgi:hypothetical protein